MLLEGLEGIEPSTRGLKGPCSTTELQAQTLQKHVMLISNRGSVTSQILLNLLATSPRAVALRLFRVPPAQALDTGLKRPLLYH